ncbi:MAG: hypothetical protein ACYSUA_04525 [Planctomycetota bacterium]
MHGHLGNRRDFLAASAATVPLLAAMKTASQPAHRRPAVISSRNGLHAAELAMSALRQGADPLVAVVTGVNEVENDPDDMSVGYGGLPNGGCPTRMVSSSSTPRSCTARRTRPAPWRRCATFASPPRWPWKC